MKAIMKLLLLSFVLFGLVLSSSVNAQDINSKCTISDPASYKGKAVASFLQSMPMAFKVSFVIPNFINSGGILKIIYPCDSTLDIEYTFKVYPIYMDSTGRNRREDLILMNYERLEIIDVRYQMRKKVTPSLIADINTENAIRKICMEHPKVCEMMMKWQETRIREIYDYFRSKCPDVDKPDEEK